MREDVCVRLEAEAAVAWEGRVHTRREMVAASGAGER
jgi:hypothetical protein